MSSPKFRVSDPMPNAVTKVCGTAMTDAARGLRLSKRPWRCFSPLARLRTGQVRRTTSSSGRFAHTCTLHSNQGGSAGPFLRSVTSKTGRMPSPSARGYGAVNNPTCFLAEKYALHTLHARADVSQLARLKDPEIRETVYMVSVEDNHEGGSWTLCTASGLDDTECLSEPSNVVQRALDRFRAVVEGYTAEHEIALTQQLEQETGRKPSDFGLACHVAKQYKDRHPYVRHCELVFLGPTYASEDGCSCEAGPSGPSKVPSASLTASGQLKAACRSAVSALRARMSGASGNRLEVSTPTRPGELLRSRGRYSRLGEGNEGAK